MIAVPEAEHGDGRGAGLFLTEVQRTIFPYFLYQAFAHISGGAILKNAWHLEALAFELERVSRGKSSWLIINMPPRNHKSITVSVAWVAFMLGQNPQLNFVCVSYSQDLAGKFARDCISIMESAWYRQLFPKTRLARRANLDFTTTAGGGRLATSTEGTLTGRGGDIIIIDDPSKPDEALSETQRTKIENWYRSTLLSRLNDKEAGAIIVIMQRIHLHDLTGLLLRNDEEWSHLCFPAIATRDESFPLLLGGKHHRRIGDVLNPDHESATALAKLERDLGSYYWNAQYQQAPVPEEGNFVKRSWFTYFNPDRPPFEDGRVVQSWDTASRDGIHNDYSVCVTAVIYREAIYIIDVYRAKVTFPVLLEQVTILARRYRATALLIEDAASGHQLIDMIRSKTPQGVPLPIARRPESDKRTRFAAQSSRIQSGQVILASGTSWVEQFVDELVSFPAGHDDQVDALAQLLQWVWRYWQSTDTMGGAPIEVTASDLPPDLDDDASTPNWDESERETDDEYR
jgi:predicted phage terminase large subunit-like protein